MTAVALGDVRKHLNISDLRYDDELTGVLAAAEATISRWVGPLEPTAVTEVVTANSEGLLLSTTPVLSLTSVNSVSSGASYMVGTSVNSASGLVTNTSSLGTRDYTVVYQAGRTTIPPDLALAVKELARHLWESQRGPARAPGLQTTEGPVADPGAGYLMPYRVQELLVPHMQYGFS